MFQELLSSSRFWSLLWRTGAMAVAFILGAVLTNLQVLELSPQMTVFIGLVIGEITKALNNYAHSEM